MSSKNKTGLPARGICIDWETSGYNPPREMQGHFIGYADKHQGIALGAAIFDVETFEVIDTFYVDIKFDESKYIWSDGAEKIHGLTREYLNKNGETADSMTNRKTQAQRLRGCLFKVWETKGSPGSFETYYQSQMELIIEQVKSKIDL
jgi:hypothetical protein